MTPKPQLEFGFFGIGRRQLLSSVTHLIVLIDDQVTVGVADGHRRGGRR
jgi:hypothetical protein